MATTKKQEPDMEVIKEKKTFYLIDGSGFIFRAFHSSPLDAYQRSDGVYTNAVAGYCSMLLKLMDQAKSGGKLGYMAVIFDAGRKTFRNDIYPEYKANRDSPPEELIPQFELVREATRAFNLPAVQMVGYEADDLIATYARGAADRGIEVIVVSSDKDLMQLVQPGITMFDPMKNLLINEGEVVNKFGVIPQKVIDVQSLAGDSADNVPGIPGIGVKTAALLINEFGDLDTLLSRANEIKQPKRRENLIKFTDKALLSRRLVTLKDDVEVNENIDDFTIKELDPSKIVSFLKRMEFRTLTSRMESRFLLESNSTENTDSETEERSTNKKYLLIQDEESLLNWIKKAYKVGVVAFDTETTSLNAMQAELVGFSLSTSSGNACYVPLKHIDKITNELDLAGNERKKTKEIKQIPITVALTLLKGLIEDPSILKVAHNAKYDLMVISRNCKRHLNQENTQIKTLRPAAVDDTMLLSYVLDAGRGKHNLDDLAFRHLNHQTIKFSDVTGKGKSRISFAEVPIETALKYAAEDADITLQLYKLFKSRLTKEKMNTVYETIERPLINIICEIEETGIKVNSHALINLSNDFAIRTKKLEEKAHQEAGEVFNIASPKQLGEILFTKLGIEGSKKGKAGAFSTGANILEDLAAQGHNLPQTVLDWRQLAKLKSTYTEALVKQINADTGRIHTSYGMATAQTGRLSSNEPNLQNIPVRTAEGRKIRAAFIPEDGYKLLSLDYSQIELRVLAHVAKVSALRKAFEQGQDIHALTASQVFNVPLGSLPHDLRRRAKAINFGIIYGISAFGLARNLGISRSDAQAYIDAYFLRFPEIRDYMDTTILFAKENGYVNTMFGRRIHINGIKDKNPMIRGGAERQAINAPIQGAAADIIKRAMIRMGAVLSNKGLNAKILLQVHDELLFELPKNEEAATIKAASEVMENAAFPAVNISVPLVAEAGFGDTWDEAH
tara:strand:+ start:4884 stop:7760 length:2877 start_codon:yes stop_codon:yes gene_type:complete